MRSLCPACGLSLGLARTSRCPLLIAPLCGDPARGATTWGRPAQPRPASPPRRRCSYCPRVSSHLPGRGRPTLLSLRTMTLHYLFSLKEEKCHIRTPTTPTMTQPATGDGSGEVAVTAGARVGANVPRATSFLGPGGSDRATTHRMDKGDLPTPPNFGRQT